MDCVSCGEACAATFLLAPCGHVFHEGCVDECVGSDGRVVCPGCHRPAVRATLWRTYWDASVGGSSEPDSSSAPEEAGGATPRTRSNWRRGWRAVLRSRARADAAEVDAVHAREAALLSAAERENVERAEASVRHEIEREEAHLRDLREKGLNAAALADSAAIFNELLVAQGEEESAGLLRSLEACQSRSIVQLGRIQARLMKRMQAKYAERLAEFARLRERLQKARKQAAAAAKSAAEGARSEGGVAEGRRTEGGHGRDGGGSAQPHAPRHGARPTTDVVVDGMSYSGPPHLPADLPADPTARAPTSPSATSARAQPPSPAFKPPSRELPRGGSFLGASFMATAGAARWRKAAIGPHSSAHFAEPRAEKFAERRPSAAATPSAALPGASDGRGGIGASRMHAGQHNNRHTSTTRTDGAGDVGDAQPPRAQQQGPRPAAAAPPPLKRRPAPLGARAESGKRAKAGASAQMLTMRAFFSRV